MFREASQQNYKICRTERKTTLNSASCWVLAPNMIFRNVTIACKHFLLAVLRNLDCFSRLGKEFDKMHRKFIKYGSKIATEEWMFDIGQIKEPQ